MKRFVQVFFLLASMMAAGIAIFYFSLARTQSEEASVPLTGRNLSLAPGASKIPSPDGKEPNRVINRIPVKPEELVLDVVDANLDADSGDEQIFTVRDRNLPETGIKVVVADYLPTRKVWLRSWEGMTPVTKPTTFTLRIADLAGDGSLMIVCTGLDRNNQQNLVAFRRSDVSGSLAYSLVCSVGGDSIEIVETERSESYQRGTAKAAPWDIIAYTRDPGSTNYLDRIRTKWTWDAARARYVASPADKVPGMLIEKESIQKILTGSAKDFENFIRGVWYREDGGIEGADSRFIDFGTKERSVTFKSASGQEVYSWIDSNATAAGIFMALDNESLGDFRRLMGVDLVAANAVRVRVNDKSSMRIVPDSGYSGKYRKLDIPASAGRTQDATASLRMEDLPDLTGSYLSGSGHTLVFSGKNFISREKKDGTSISGGYRIYRLGSDLVLDMTVIGGDGLPAGRKLYRIEYGERSIDGRTIKTIEMMPSLMGMGGLKVLEEGKERYSTGYDS